MDYPPIEFAHQPKRVPSAFSYEGALQLAQNVRDAWAACGREINVWIEKTEGIHVVRSDTVNGMPRS